MSLSPSTDPRQEGIVWYAKLLFVRVLNEGSAGSVVVSPLVFLRILKEGAVSDSPSGSTRARWPGRKAGRQARSAPQYTEPAPVESRDDDSAITCCGGVDGCARMDLYPWLLTFHSGGGCGPFQIRADGPLVVGLRLPSHDPGEYSTQLLQARPVAVAR
jgi:hypothetical protein